MSEPAALALAAAGLLILPGPTNALLAAAGAHALRAALSLLPVVLAAYALTIGGALLVLAAGGGAAPGAGTALRVAAAVFLVWLALRLWRRGRDGGGSHGPAVRPGEIFVATLLNPKGLILALLVPPGGTLAGQAAILAAMILATGLLWVAAGQALARAAPRLVAGGFVDRIGAAAIAGFAVYFLATAAAALPSA